RVAAFRLSRLEARVFDRAVVVENVLVALSLRRAVGPGEADGLAADAMGNGDVGHGGSLLGQWGFDKAARRGVQSALPAEANPMKTTTIRNCALALAAAGAFVALPAQAGKTIDAIKARGQLVCGLNNPGLPGFSQADSQGNWS